MMTMTFSPQTSAAPMQRRSVVHRPTAVVLPHDEAIVLPADSAWLAATRDSLAYLAQLAKQLPQAETAEPLTR